MSLVKKLGRAAKRKSVERLEICQADWRRLKRRIGGESRVEWYRRAALALLMADLMLILWVH